MRPAARSRFWDYFRNAWGCDAGPRIDHLVLSSAVARRLVYSGADREVRGWELDRFCDGRAGERTLALLGRLPGQLRTS